MWLETIPEKLIAYAWKQRDNLIAILSGDFLTFMIVMNFDFFHAAVKLLGVFAVGVVGGFGGLLGKKMFGWVEKGYTLLRKRWKK